MENENLNDDLNAKIGANKQKTNARGKQSDTSLQMYMGKVQPQARSLEEAVLGALMLDKDAVAVVVDILQPGSFYVEAHRHIYKAICTLFEKSHPVDLLTVTEELKRMGVLETIGGPFYLVELTNRVASAANIEYHARIIAQKFIQRELIRVSTDTIKEAYEDTTDVFDLLDKAENNLFAITESNLSRSYMGMSTLMNLALKQLEELSKRTDGLTGVPSGFTALDRLTSGWQPSDLIILAARPGMGKCHGAGTKLVMYDGSIKVVEDVRVGDQLMGVDSKPRTVLSVAHGREQMYWVHQNKGISYRVNESHILSLKRSRNEGKHHKGDVLNISVRDYLQQSPKFRSNYKGYKTAVEFPAQALEIDPYFLGLWLGDGTSSKPAVTAIEPEIVDSIYEFAGEMGCSVTKFVRKENSSETYSLATPRGQANPFLDLLKALNLLNNKHIPHHYIANSTENRLALLAGLMDSDGHYQAGFKCYEITQKNEELAKQIKFLCDTLGFRTKLTNKRASIRSLGFECTVYRLRIFGDIDRIPVRVPRKRAEQRMSIVDWQVTGIRVMPDVVDDYYGFELDGDGLYLLEDCTVTHNTSLTLAVTCNAAIDFRKPVAFFSLEMSSLQLVNRIIAMQTEISSEKLRHGKLEDHEWTTLNAAAARLSEVPIFIDDTPGISIFELRAKCRRLKMQHDIQIIIIDYLQLMTAGGDGKGNREQEISTISRSLKGLAKELSVPIIALSQLSRAVEVRGGSKRPQLSDLRECVTGDTKVLLRDGTWAQIRDLVGTTPTVWAMHNDRLRLQSGVSDLVWSVGKKSVFNIRLASGRSIRATAEHRLFGASGWQTVDSLKVGSRLGILRRLPEPENPVFEQPEKLVVLAHLIGDGSYLKGQPLRYTTATESHSKIVRESAEKAFGVRVNRHESKTGTWHQLVFSGNGNRWQKKGLSAWLESLGIWGQRSHEKHLPKFIYQLNNDQLAFFLRHLWATDGTIFTPKTEDSSSRVAFSTCSRALADDVAMLLLRFEIVARIRTVEQGEHRPMYSVEVSGGADQLRFLDLVGAFGAKESQAEALRTYLQGRKSNTNVDTLPQELFDYVKDQMQAQGISQRRMAELRGTSYGGASHFGFSPSRALVREYAEILDDSKLADWADSDVFWDKVVQIEPAGEEEVFDLTVLEHHNWIANGIISHNSGAIEQDADIVGFIYRPEYYGILEDEEGHSLKGIGEVIIAKHRNGALDSVRLKWDGQFAKFSNLDDDAYGDSAFFEMGGDFSGQVIQSKMNDHEQMPPSAYDDIPF